jgi:S1/P1 Nuclease
MKISRLLLCFLIIGGTAPTVFGWGNEGHRTIGAMADKLIAGTAAAQHVHELLGDETLSVASVWADTVKGRDNQTEEMLQFKAANPNHSVSHYTDIPFEEPRYRDDSIGATNVDVVHAIPACILILQGKPEQQSIFKDVTPRVALRLLVHFIEDIHQPLHVGAGYLDQTKFVDPNGYAGHYGDDQGGNRLLFGGTNKLHFYWDVTVVQADMAKAHMETPAQYADYLLSKPVPKWKTSGPLLDWDRAWANESLTLAAEVHHVTVTDEDDSQTDFRTGQPRPQWHIQDLTPEYIAWSDKVAEEQMAKAGCRLAATLEAIWPDQK